MLETSYQLTQQTLLYGRNDAKSCIPKSQQSSPY